MSSLVKLHDHNPDVRKLQQVVQSLDRNGVVVCPTDTVYSFASKLGNAKGFDRIARLKGLKPDKAHFSLLCADTMTIFIKEYEFLLRKKLNMETKNNIIPIKPNSPVNSNKSECA